MNNNDSSVVSYGIFPWLWFWIWGIKSLTLITVVYFLIGIPTPGKKAFIKGQGCLTSIEYPIVQMRWFYSSLFSWLIFRTMVDSLQILPHAPWCYCVFVCVVSRTAVRLWVASCRSGTTSSRPPPWCRTCCAPLTRSEQQWGSTNMTYQ